MRKLLASPRPCALPRDRGVAAAAPTVPTDIEQPGTQPTQVGNLETPDKCDNCHGGYNAAVEPAFNWRGSMMANARPRPDLLGHRGDRRAGLRRLGRPVHPLPQHGRLVRRPLHAHRRQRADRGRRRRRRLRHLPQDDQPQQQRAPRRDERAVHRQQRGDARNGLLRVGDAVLVGREREARPLQRPERQARLHAVGVPPLGGYVRVVPRRVQPGRGRPGAQQRQAANGRRRWWRAACPARP